MNNSEALTQLQQAIAKFNNPQKLAFVTYLTENANPRLATVIAEATGNPENELTQACDLVAQFPNSVKLLIAIQLLERQVDRQDAVDFPCPDCGYMHKPGKNTLCNY